MRILITGAQGQLGRCLIDRMQNYSFDTSALSREQLDITKKDDVEESIKANQPDVVVNAAAYTAVDKAEEDVENAYLVNETGPRILAEACKKYGSILIHVSTDYVFDGKASNPYQPTDQVNPQSIYGKSKWAGEQAVREILDDHVIIRTAWVFSEYGNNFVKTILRLANSRNQLKIVADQYGCPTYAGDLAQAIFKVCLELEGGNTNRGTYHYCGTPATNWCDFAKEIVKGAHTQNLLSKPTEILAIPHTEYPLPAPRPDYSVLNCDYTVQEFNVDIGDWRQSLIKVVAVLEK